MIISPVKAIETKIIHFIGNEIITNVDIKDQFKYLLVLNNNLKELDKESIFKISNESRISETIKKIEISKYIRCLYTCSENKLRRYLIRLHATPVENILIYVKYMSSHYDS